MDGAWISGAAAIAYALQEENVFIVATVTSTNLKMVKIRVKNEHEFDWIDAKYSRDFPTECSTKETFNENCFQGTSVTQEQYNVKLVATCSTDQGKGLLTFHLIRLSITTLYHFNCNLF